MFLMNKVSAIKTSLPTYLQSLSNDYIEALIMVDIAEQKLSELRMQALSEAPLIQEAKEFSIENELNETEFFEFRIRK